MKLKIILLISSLLCAKAIFADIKYNSLSVKHIESKGVGYDSGYTTLQAFLCADPSFRVSPLLDLRAHVFDNGKWAANAGVGARYLWKDRIYGINAYYDYRNTKHLSYNQLGVGLETLGSFIDARINGYLPWGQKISPGYSTQFYGFSGNSLILCQKHEFAMKGAGAEVGFHLGDCHSWSLYGAAGPYYFHGPIGGNAWGGKARLSVSYGQYVSFEVIESYDNVFHNRVQGQISLSIPLGRKNVEKSLNSIGKLHCRMAQVVMRNEIIVVDHKKQYPEAINPITGLPYSFVFVDNTSSSLGTYESPYPSLQQAQDNSIAGQIIYIFPGDGTTANMDRGIVLKPSQKMWGSALSYTLPTTAGSITIPPMSASFPQISNTNGSGAGITLSSNNEVSGLIITQTGGQGIFGSNPGSFSLSSCVIKECGLSEIGITPIFIQSNTPLVANFDSNIFSENPNAGVYIELNTGVSSATLTFTRNQALDNEVTIGEGAILNIDPNGTIGDCTLYVENNTATNNSDLFGVNISNILGGRAGSFNSFIGTFSQNSFTNGGKGINYSVNGNSANISITNNNLSNNPNGSVAILAGDDRIRNLTLLLSDNQMNGASGGGVSGVDLSAHADDFSFSILNNSISNNNTSAIIIYNDAVPPANLDITIANNVIQNNFNDGANAAGGISIDGYQSLTALIENNQLSNNFNGSKIGFYGNSVPVPSGNAVVVFEDNQLSTNDQFEFQFWGDDPTTGCLSITRNTSTAETGYLFSKQGSGACTITPVSYLTDNVGGFSLTDVTPAASCPAGVED